MLQLRQTQGLQQRLTPQQVQYLKLLQLPILALEQRIKSEIEENPMLEETSEDEEIPQQQSEESIAEPVEILDAMGDTAEIASETNATEAAALRDLQRTNEQETTLTREQAAEDKASNDYTFEDFMNDDTEGFKSPTPGIQD